MPCGTSAPASPARKPAIAPKPSSLKSPPLPTKQSHGLNKTPVPTPKPRKLQATHSSPTPVSGGTGGPPPVKTKTFHNAGAGHRANSEDSGIFDLRDSAELSKAEVNIGEVKDSILEEPIIMDERLEIVCRDDIQTVKSEDASPVNSLTSSPKRSPPKPLPRRAPPSPVPPPRRAKSVIDPPNLNRSLKPKLNKSTDDLTACQVEEEIETEASETNDSAISYSPVKSSESKADRTCPNVENDRFKENVTPPPVPPHKQNSPSRTPPINQKSSKPARPPPPSKAIPVAPPVRPKPISKKIETPEFSRHPSVDGPGVDGSCEASPKIPPRTRRSLVTDDKLLPNQTDKIFFPENGLNGEAEPLPDVTSGSSGSEKLIKIPPRKRWSQHANSSLTAMPYHKVQSPDPASPKSPEVTIHPSGIVGYHSVAPPRPVEGPPKRLAPVPPSPYSSTAKQSRPIPDDSQKRVPPPRPPPLRSALPPKPATLIKCISQEQDTDDVTDFLTAQDSSLPPENPSSTMQSDKNADRQSVVSDDDEYVLPDGEYVFPDGPHYENNEVVPVFEPLMSPPLSPSPESGPTKRLVPGRQKRVPPPKPKRTPSIQSDISNDGYEDMSRGSFASVALSSISAEVYSVPRSCEHSMHESGRCQCADYAEQSSGEDEGSSDDDEDSYEKFDQGVMAEKEEDVEPEVRKRRKAFLVAQELRDSEKVFVDVLRLINVDFKVAIEDAERSAGRPIIEKGLLDQILGHLPQLQMFNEDLLADLDSRVSNWAENPRIADIFLKKGPYLKLYNTYIRDFQKLTATVEEACQKSPLFNATLREFEASSRCQNLSLRQHMLKPIQRIPQYKLLLTEYLKQLDEEAQEEDFKDTMAALNIVSEVANHVNESMKQGDNLDKLLQLQQSLVGNHEIVRPGRVFIKEGDLLKLSRKVPQTRRFYLLSDILLYTTPFLLTPGQYNYKLHNVLSLAGMRVSKPAQEDYKNEFSIISVQRSFTLAANTPEERDSWVAALNKAITEYASKRSSFAVLHPQYAQLLSEGDSTSLGRKAPAWIPDARVTMCMICTCEFTITWRRHHCRACGKVVCGNCSANKIPLHYLANKVARVCDQCYRTLVKGDKQGEDMEDGKDQSKGKGKRKRSAKPIIRPSALKQVSASEQDTSMSGYLMLRRKKDWKRQWYVLKEKVLYRYKASEDVAALESMPLLGYEIQILNEPFEGVEAGFIIQLCHQSKVLFQLRAENKPMAEKWAVLMTEATHL
ncbi:FYVE, RhoGEF and PH domain-containing protein 6-like isoform X2 [Acanthaster planci]|uniref:FYVE, RhoGEF and PH domain-containing protein 6-like isoform X2 n=1 Tax=Acanthaster planci TaxID=133434 RepID=A0A8B7Z009_ACAPL|nr:FYVE, RhoGEF and PH domain-containing protein 6-like isoform X2 [Acanthaster planci]